VLTMERFIPHTHTCEVKMCYHITWREYCPYHSNLSETEDECEQCAHFVTVEFNPDNPLCIDKVVHMNA
jgi:hypothetical protein